MKMLNDLIEKKSEHFNGLSQKIIVQKLSHCVFEMLRKNVKRGKKI